MSALKASHPLLGTIRIIPRANSRKISARWVGGELRVNVPASLSRSEIARAIADHIHDFEKIRPRSRYSPGMRLEFDGGLSVALDAASGSVGRFAASSVKDKAYKPLHILAPKEGAERHYTITLAPDADFTSAATARLIDAALKAIARREAPSILLPRARETAARLGLDVKRWEISHGKTILGLCFPRERRIKLSYMCVFLSAELRDFIICHELAHLRVHGHTPAFHALCDSYLGGHESRLHGLLKRFPWPVDR